MSNNDNINVIVNKDGNQLDPNNSGIGNVFATKKELASEHWFKSYWRPFAAWSYIAIVLFDFLLAPILNGVFFYLTGMPFIPWHPLTLEGGGLFHLAFGSFVGIYSYGRTKEKLFGATNSTEINSAPTKPPGGNSHVD